MRDKYSNKKHARCALPPQSDMPLSQSAKLREFKARRMYRWRTQCDSIRTAIRVAPEVDRNAPQRRFDRRKNTLGDAFRLIKLKYAGVLPKTERPSHYVLLGNTTNSKCSHHDHLPCSVIYLYKLLHQTDISRRINCSRTTN